MCYQYKVYKYTVLIRSKHSVIEGVHCKGLIDCNGPLANWFLSPSVRKGEFGIRSRFTLFFNWNTPLQLYKFFQFEIGLNKFFLGVYLSQKYNFSSKPARIIYIRACYERGIHKNRAYLTKQGKNTYLVITSQRYPSDNNFFSSVLL